MFAVARSGRIAAPTFIPVGTREGADVTTTISRTEREDLTEQVTMRRAAAYPAYRARMREISSVEE